MSGSRWYPAYIGLGSNLSNPSQQIDSAFDRLGDIPDSTLIRRSSLYRSAPFGGVEQADFMNAAASLLTKLDAQSLLAQLQQIEAQFGRVRDATRWGPRIIDLDLLVYSNHDINDDNLTVPHPGIAERNFVLLPLLEIAPDLSISGLGRLSTLDVQLDEPEISKIA